MNRHLVAIGMVAILGAVGCASMKPDAKIGEAMDRVEQNTGHRPEWDLPWDKDAPVWTDESVLRLDQALVLALRNNRELRADLEMIGQANADLVQAGLLQNPVINFMIMFPDGGGRSMLRGNGLPMQPLQDLWLIPTRKKVAQAELQNAVLRVADRAVEIAAAVKKVYARLQYTQRAIELTRDNMQVVEQSTRIISVRQSAGKATQTAVNLSQIRYLKLRSELLSMEAEHAASQRELLMLMGLADGPVNWRVEPIAEITQPVEEPTVEAELVAAAREQRLDLKAAGWRADEAENNIRLQRLGGLPMLSLGFSFERSPAPRSNNPSWRSQAGNTALRGLSDRLQGMPSAAMPMPFFGPKMREVKYAMGPMLEMSLPIFDWNQARTARAVHELAQRVAEYEAKLQEIIRMVRDKRGMLQQAYAQVRFYRESIVPAVERNLDVARRSFVAGQEDLTVYLEVQEDLLMTRLKILEFFRDYLVNRADLEREVGGELAVPTSQPATALASPAGQE